MESSSCAGSQWLLFQQLQHLSPTLHGEYDVSDLPARPSQGTRRPPEPPVRQLQLLLQLQLVLLLHCCARNLLHRRGPDGDVLVVSTGMLSNAAEVVVVRAAVQPRHAQPSVRASSAAAIPPFAAQGGYMHM